MNVYFPSEVEVHEVLPEMIRKTGYVIRSAEYIKEPLNVLHRGFFEEYGDQKHVEDALLLTNESKSKGTISQFSLYGEEVYRSFMDELGTNTPDELIGKEIFVLTEGPSGPGSHTKALVVRD